jgi:hypothetical protein
VLARGREHRLFLQQASLDLQPLLRYGCIALSEHYVSLLLFRAEIFVSCPEYSSCFHEEKIDGFRAYLSCEDEHGIASDTYISLRCVPHTSEKESTA